MGVEAVWWPLCRATAMPTGMFARLLSSREDTESGEVTVSLFSLFLELDSLEAGLVNNESTLGLKN